MLYCQGCNNILSFSAVSHSHTALTGLSIPVRTLVPQMQEVCFVFVHVVSNRTPALLVDILEFGEAALVMK